MKVESAQKNCCHQSCSFWLIYAPNRLSAGALPQTPLGKLIIQRSRPDSLAGLWGGAPGEREGGRGSRRREGRDSRNAQIQSWQAYAQHCAADRDWTVQGVSVYQSVEKIQHFRRTWATRCTDSLRPNPLYSAGWDRLSVDPVYRGKLEKVPSTNGAG